MSYIPFPTSSNGSPTVTGFNTTLRVQVSALTQNRSIVISGGDANYTITLSGNPTLSDWFDQSVKTSASPTFAGLDSPIGQVTPRAGSFTTLSTSGTITGVSDGSPLNPIYTTYEDTIASAGSAFILRRARGSLASPTAVLSGDRIGGFFFGGLSTGTTFQNTAGMAGVATENWGATAAGQQIEIYATANGSVARSTVGYFRSTGLSVIGLITGGSTTLIASSVALTNGAAAQVGTLTNAPSAGNPTKWVPIDDNGTTRYIPAW